VSELRQSDAGAAMRGDVRSPRHARCLPCVPGPTTIGSFQRHLWFDGNELLQMSPAATLELFSTITREPPAHHPATSTPTCPRCAAALAESSDMQRTTRFFFLCCPRGHGRFLTFFQFLRAKNFVRSLSEAEIRHLREYVRQINCSNCGAAVDVERVPSAATVARRFRCSIQARCRQRSARSRPRP
jgi:hypothetical protein